MIGKLFPIQHLWTSPHPACLTPSLPPSLPPSQLSVWQSDFSTYPHMGLSFISPMWCYPTQLHAQPLINKARVSCLGTESVQNHPKLALFSFFKYLSLLPFREHIYSSPPTHSVTVQCAQAWRHVSRHMYVHVFIHLHKPAHTLRILDRCCWFSSFFFLQKQSILGS